MRSLLHFACLPTRLGAGSPSKRGYQVTLLKKNFLAIVVEVAMVVVAAMAVTMAMVVVVVATVAVALAVAFEVMSVVVAWYSAKV